MSLRVTSLPAGCLMMDFASMVWCCSPVDGVLCFVVVCNCAVTPDAVNPCFDWCFHRMSEASLSDPGCAYCHCVAVY